VKRALGAGKRLRLAHTEPKPRLPTAALGRAAGAFDPVAFPRALARLARGRAAVRDPRHRATRPGFAYAKSRLRHLFPRDRAMGRLADVQRALRPSIPASSSA